ncbi:hypothetical protein LCGC14_2951440, partial [marine sediment metagenome]
MHFARSEINSDQVLHLHRMKEGGRSLTRAR